MRAEIERMRKLLCWTGQYAAERKRAARGEVKAGESRRPSADVLLPCEANGTGSYTIAAGDLYRCLLDVKGRSQIVNVEGIVVGLSTFRKWARLMKGDPLTMVVYGDRLEFSAQGHLTVIRHGAWDKAGGAGGYDVEIVPVG